MPLADSVALEGIGVPSQLAALLGAVPVKLNGVGTAQVGATLLTSKSVELVPASSNTAFIIGTDIGISEPIFVFNAAASAVAALVFCPVGGTLSGTLNNSVNGGTGIAQNKAAWIWQYKKGFWAAVLTA